MLLAYDVEDGLLDVEEAEFDPLHVLQLVRRRPLHLEDLIVACLVVEGVGPVAAKKKGAKN